MAKNRYGWKKRAKELSRKMKQEEKMKRRQAKSQEKAAAVVPPGDEVESSP